MTEKAKKAQDRYTAAITGLTQGINILVQELPSQRVAGECSPKELRTATLLNSIRLDALTALLLDAEAFSEQDLMESLADHAEAQIKQYEERLSKILGGRKVSLLK